MKKLNVTAVCKNFSGVSGRVPVENAIPVRGENGQMIMPAREMLIRDVIIQSLDRFKVKDFDEAVQIKSLADKVKFNDVVELTETETEIVEKIMLAQVAPVAATYLENLK